MAILSRKPLCIFTTDDNDRSSVTGERLLDKLCYGDESLEDLKVVVVAVSGRYRRGKSFLLNYIIRYLESNRDPCWFNDKDKVLRGFDWGHGRQRVTNGIQIWPKVFKVRGRDGHKVAVVLMDTQGVFDNQADDNMDTSIFSLSVMLSSVQIFNVVNDIQGDDFCKLQLFIEYANYLTKARQGSGDNARPVTRGEEKPLQDLVFLVRDWFYPDEYPYGWEGGADVLQFELNRTGLSDESASMRQSVRDIFKSTTCYLMPYPGDTANRKPAFKGQIKDMEPDFSLSLKKFIEDLLSPERLVPKTVDGHQITLGDFCVYTETFADCLAKRGRPHPGDIRDAFGNGINTALLRRCTNAYSQHMSRVTANNALDDFEMNYHHGVAKDKALRTFESAHKMGPLAQQRRLRQNLESKIDTIYKQCRKANDKQREFEKAKAEYERLRREDQEASQKEKKRREYQPRLETPWQANAIVIGAAAFLGFLIPGGSIGVRLACAAAFAGAAYAQVRSRR